MGRAKYYFEPEPGAPAPLIASASRRIRFEEVDMLGIVWHGHYVSYLDDGRVAFGDKYGLSYTVMKEAKIAAPIVQMHLDYISPLNFDKELLVETTLHWSDALKLNFEYKLSSEGRLAVRGYTVQLFVDLKGQTVFIPPEFLIKFRKNWVSGEW